MEWKTAMDEGAKLLVAGNIDVVLAWLRHGKSYGLPARVLSRCGKQEVAARVIPLLNDASHDLRTRAAAALGPLGGDEAAKLLCANLRDAELHEQWAIADALGRIAWPGAVGPLTDAVNASKDSSVRAQLASAIVRCGDRVNGLNILYRGLSEDGASNDYASALAKLDEDGLTDSRLVPEMIALLERTGNNASRVIVGNLVDRHTGEWEAIKKSRPEG
jgi:HEAT repeat protein